MKLPGQLTGSEMTSPKAVLLYQLSYSPEPETQLDWPDSNGRPEVTLPYDTRQGDFSAELLGLGQLAAGEFPATIAAGRESNPT
ncbi:hypothetical protein K3G63_01670 [Hymenobacter sp. HSC-4F20]|uniref:hypothetical protein n=1 Tax=Hymenobacter sp. HSC-4F20 TaxID=2864135 RepID=UPI001C73C19C|nr:hypothetical protein [Hymenobacter sp. HSC-4F20]MBX0289125.1 hypothetical protein [Hymenobacter sp. HSC-4F20]